MFPSDLQSFVLQLAESYLRLDRIRIELEALWGRYGSGQIPPHVDREWSTLWREHDRLRSEIVGVEREWEQLLGRS